MSKKREHKPTSKSAHEFIKVHKSELYQKIKEGLERLKVGGTFAEIAKSAGLKPEQVWKRLSEMSSMNTIYPTGLTRKLPSGRLGIIWQLHGLEAGKDAPVIETPQPKKEKKQSLPVIKQDSLF